MVMARTVVLCHSADASRRDAVAETLRLYFPSFAVSPLPGVDVFSSWGKAHHKDLVEAECVLLISSVQLLAASRNPALAGLFTTALDESAIAARLYQPGGRWLRYPKTRRTVFDLQCPSEHPAEFEEQLNILIDGFLSLNYERLCNDLNTVLPTSTVKVLGNPDSGLDDWLDFYVRAADDHGDRIRLQPEDWRELSAHLEGAFLPRNRFRHALLLLCDEGWLTHRAGWPLVGPDLDQHDDIAWLFGAAREPARALILALSVCRKAAKYQQGLSAWLEKFRNGTHSIKLKEELAKVEGIRFTAEWTVSCVVDRDADGKARAEIYEARRFGKLRPVRRSEGVDVGMIQNLVAEAAAANHLAAAIAEDQLWVELYLDADDICDAVGTWRIGDWRLWSDHPLILRAAERLHGASGDFVPDMVGALSKNHQFWACGAPYEPLRVWVLEHRPDASAWTALLDQRMMFAVFPQDPDHSSLTQDLASMGKYLFSQSSATLRDLPVAFRDLRSGSSRAFVDPKNWYLFFDDPGSRIRLEPVRLAAS
jgi:hypothetical protein